MKILVNDAWQNLEEPSTLQDLIQSLKLTGKTGIAIAVNESVVARSFWPDCSLHERDRVTIIQATQGG